MTKRKNFDFLMIITTIICLLPLILSISLYSQLPESMPIHFNTKGEADNYAPKALAVFGIPILIAIFNLILHFALNKDPRNNSTPRLVYLGKWFLPLIVVIFMPINLFWALGYNIPIEIIVPCFIGIIFIIIGNYLPKCKQNHTVGIKLPWTLNSKAIWNKTHRLSGYLWIGGGLVLIVGSFLKILWVYLILIFLILTILIPIIYSYLLFKKEQ